MTSKRKSIKAVSPYIENGNQASNFKLQPYNAWKNVGGRVAPSHYPWKVFRALVHRISFPTLWQSSREARLRFVEAGTMNYDAWSDYLTHEVIPLVWDCWPRIDDNVVAWFKKHKVRTCIFTCRESAARIKARLPHLNMLVITEGVDVKKYPMGLPLKEREYDFYRYGRFPKCLWSKEVMKDIKYVWAGSNEQFAYRLCNSKITVAYPQCDVFPERTGGQETLTQRYWEGMLSGMLMIGRAPKELTDLIGYNPVIDFVDNEHVSTAADGELSEAFAGQLKDILAHIEDYQELVDKNRETALKMAPWELRMKQVMEWLESQGYSV